MSPRNAEACLLFTSKSYAGYGTLYGLGDLRGVGLHNRQRVTEKPFVRKESSCSSEIL